MTKKVIILLMTLCLASSCACGQPEKEPVIPTPDGIACNNDVFADLETSSVAMVGCWTSWEASSVDGYVYREDIVYDFVKYLKEETFYEATPAETTYYGGTTFVIVLKNGERHAFSFAGKCLRYGDQFYTGYSSALSGNLRALFDA